MRASRKILNLYDPNFMVRLKRLQSRYRDAYQSEGGPISNQAYMDFTDRGAAWFIGNMAKTKIELEKKMRHVDFILEVRDARLPFTTANPDIDQLTKDKPRLIIFNKADLANKQCNETLAQFYESSGAYVIFTNAEVAWKMTLNCVIRFVTKCVPSIPFKTAPHLGLLVGMPNVGKTSILNTLRVAHEFQFQKAGACKHREAQVVSASPGSTRRLTTVPVSLDPPISVMDTPGLTLPGNFSYKAGRKLALLGIVPRNTSTVHCKNLAEHVFDLLSKSGMSHHLAECMKLSRIPLDFNDCIMLLAKRSGTSAHNQIGNINRDVIYSMIVDDFQAGRLGRMTLDSMPSHQKPLNLAQESEVNGNSYNDFTHQSSEQEVHVQEKQLHDKVDQGTWDKGMRDTINSLRSMPSTISRKRGPISLYKLDFKLHRPL